MRGLKLTWNICWNRLVLYQNIWMYNFYFGSSDNVFLRHTFLHIVQFLWKRWHAGGVVYSIMCYCSSRPIKILLNSASITGVVSNSSTAFTQELCFPVSLKGTLGSVSVFTEPGAFGKNLTLLEALTERCFKLTCCVSSALFHYSNTCHTNINIFWQDTLKGLKCLFQCAYDNIVIWQNYIQDNIFLKKIIVTKICVPVILVYQLLKRHLGGKKQTETTEP